MRLTQHSLTGQRILVTRPAHQAHELCMMIEQSGGVAISFPVIEIKAADESAVKTQLDTLAEYDLLIFVSSNAVDVACKLISDRMNAGRAGWPEGSMYASVGKKTAQRLAQCLAKQGSGREQLSPDKGFNSEGLLALPALQLMRDKKVMIFRGNGGRELLAETLSARGAQVDYAEVYQRNRPAGDVTPLLSQQLDMIIATSNEGLQNLYDMAVGHHDWLLNLPLLLMSERLLAHARKLGFHNDVIVADEASDEGLMHALYMHK